MISEKMFSPTRATTAASDQGDIRHEVRKRRVLSGCPRGAISAAIGSTHFRAAGISKPVQKSRSGAALSPWPNTEVSAST
jgi:hypothetical protein